MPDTCRAWKTVANGKVDRLCYKPHYRDGYHGADNIWFNGQMRDLSYMGSQGPELPSGLNGMEAENVCEGLCQENLGAPVLRDASHPPSHQVVWTDMDDMCEHCA